MEEAQVTLEMPRPKVVQIAAILMWVSTIIGILKSLTIYHTQNWSCPLLMVFLIGVIYWFACYSVWKTIRGSNRFRILNLIILVISFWDFVGYVKNELSISAIAGSIAIIVNVSFYLAIILLFTPSANKWFKSKL